MCSTCTSLDCNCWTTSRGVPQSWPRLQRRTKLLSLAAGGDGIQWETGSNYWLLFPQEHLFIWFQLFESTASALSFVQPFHLSGIVHTAAFKQANQIFTLCVFALLYDSTHNTVAFSPTLHKNTTGVLPHRPTTVRPAALLLPCLCFHHSVQRLHYHRQLLSAHVCHPCGETLIRFPIKPQKHLCSEGNGGCPDGFFKCFCFDYCTESLCHSNPVHNTWYMNACTQLLGPQTT